VCSSDLTPFLPEALDVAILEPATELRRLPLAEVTRRVQGMPFIGAPEKKSNGR
jgi:hypothetical protein